MSPNSLKNLTPFSSERGSIERKLQLESEIKAASEMVIEGYTIYSPTVVCDRIAVKDGHVFFVEFKKGNQRLRPAQKVIAELIPAMYIVRRS